METTAPASRFHLSTLVVLGFITLFFGIGQAVGPSVAGAIADAAGAIADAAGAIADAAGSFVPAFLLAAIIPLLGLVGVFLLKPAANASEAKGEG